MDITENGVTRPMNEEEIAEHKKHCKSVKKALSEE